MVGKSGWLGPVLAARCGCSQGGSHQYISEYVSHVLQSNMPLYYIYQYAGLVDSCGPGIVRHFAKI